MEKLMKLITFFLVLGFVLSTSNTSSAQSSNAKKSTNSSSKKLKEAKAEGTYIPKFEAGRTITQSDIGFLCMLTENKTKGSDKNKDVMVDNNKFSVNQKLTKEDASLLSSKVEEYSKVNKVEKLDADDAKVKTKYLNCYPCLTCWREICRYDYYGNYICRIYEWCCNCP